MINAREKHTPAQFTRCTHGQIVGRKERHAPQTIEGRRDVRARLVDDRDIIGSESRIGGFDDQRWRRDSQ